MDPLTSDQREQVAAFEHRVTADGIVLDGLYKTLWEVDRQTIITKLLIARRWNQNDAVMLLKTILKFRKENRLDVDPLFPAACTIRGYDLDAVQIFHGMPPREAGTLDKQQSAISAAYSACWHKWDRSGRPVFIERTGKTSPQMMVDICRGLVPPSQPLATAALNTHMHSNEVAGVLVRYQNSLHEQKICQVVGIMDCRGLSFNHMFGPLMEILKAVSHMDQAYYPEGLHRLYVAYCPPIISYFFKLLRSIIDSRVEKKIIFLTPAETENHLKGVMEEEHLPKFLGGQCECELGCCPEPCGLSDECLSEFTTEEVCVKKGGLFSRSVHIQPGYKATWEFAVQQQKDIGFSAEFTPGVPKSEATSPTCPPSPEVSDANNVPVGEPVDVQAHSLCSEGHGVYQAKEEGMLYLQWTNSHAWFAQKTLNFRIVVLPPSPE